MPRIPTQNEPRVREEVTRVGGFKSRLGDTTSRVNAGEQLAGAALQVMKINENESLKAEDIQAQEFANKLRKKKIELTVDKDKGYFRETGKDAAKNMQNYYNDYDKFTQEEITNYGGGSERLKQKLQLLTKKNRNDLYSQFSSHATKEIERYEDNVFESTIETLTSEAILNPNKIGTNIDEIKSAIYGTKDPKTGDLIMADGKPVNQGLVGRKGLDEQTAKNMFQQATTKLHTSVITNMLNADQDQIALDYFNAATNPKVDEIEGSAAVKLKAALDNASIRGQAQRATDTIMGEGLPMSDGLAKARQIEDAEVRDEVTSRVKNRYNEQKQVERIEKEENYEAIFLQVEKTMSLDGLGMRLDKLTHQQRNGIRKYLEKKASGKDIETDLGVFYQLQQMSGDKPTAFKDQNLLEYKHKLNDSHFVKLSTIQAALRKPGAGEEASKLLDGIQTKNNIVNGGLKGMGINYSGKVSQQEAEKAISFRKKVDELITEKQLEKGRKVLNNEVQEIVDNLRVKLVIDKDYLSPDDTKFAFELNQEDIDQMEYEEISKDDVEKIKESFKRKKGINDPTEKQIFEAYIKNLNKKLGRK